jgi:hypothetical protein
MCWLVGNQTTALTAAGCWLPAVAVLLLVTKQETVFQMQAAKLAATIPELFAPGCSIRLATENGRSLLAKAAFTASRCGNWVFGVLVCVSCSHVSQSFTANSKCSRWVTQLCVVLPCV